MGNDSKISGYIVKNITGKTDEGGFFTFDQYFNIFDDKTEKCPKIFFDRGYDVFVIYPCNRIGCDIAVINRECFYGVGVFFDDIIYGILKSGMVVEFGVLINYNKSCLKMVTA